MGGNKKRFLALVFLTVGAMLVAQSVFGTSGAKTPSALEWYEKGKDEQDAQNWYSAIEYYQEALRSNPSYGQAWLSLAECTYALGEYDLAISYADSAAEYLKNTTAIANLKGFALIGLARLDEARAIFDQVLTRYPNDTDARFGLAELDIFIGKISGAESLYLDALKRQPESRKALLSLALVSYELGKTKAAKEYINQALKFHSDNPEVHYFAAYILAREGSWIEAEGRVRAAIQLKPGYDEAYSLLASILYSTMRYQSVVDICEYRISRDRKSTSAWYLKGLALTRLNRIEEAITAYQSGLEVDPEDEIMRTAMEQLVCSYLDIEDGRRAKWAAWHSKKAEEFSQKYQSLQARYEYKRALIINPANANSRLAFAEILLRDGFPENYLGQLRFIREQGNESRDIEDKIESYESLLEGSLANKWDVDPFYLDKTRYKIGLYYIQPTVQLVHPDSEQLTSQMLAEALSADGRLKVSAYNSSISGYSEAFRLSRQGKQDYFGLVEFEENERELTVSLTVYVARTGNKAAEFKVYRTGNNRYANALRRMSQIVTDALPKRAKIIGRNGSTALIDFGKTEGIAKDMVFNVIKKDKVVVEDKTLGTVFDEQDLFGTVTVTQISEDISEANIKQKGFYDRINVGDELLPVPETLEKIQPAENVTVDKQKPALITLIKSIK